MSQSSEGPVLFSEFKTASGPEWAKKAQQDLKGESLDKLRWHTPEGLTIQPCYHPENVAFDFPKEAFPYVRGGKTNNNWENIQVIPVIKESVIAIDKGLHALSQGADGLHFIIEQPASFDTSYLSRKLDTKQFSVSFTLTGQPAVFLQNFFQHLAEQGASLQDLRGFICYSPEAGYDHYSRTYFDELASLLKITENSPEFYALTLNGARFGFNGGTITQEIAFTISAAVTYLDALTTRGFSPEIIARNMQLQMAVGTNYFFEIAKLRAVRLVWTTVAQAYNLAPEIAAHLRVHSQTSRWYLTAFDPHTNLLRTTTEAMAAVIGGCDSLAICAFDNAIRPESEFAERLARNISLILKEEAYLHQTIDPAAGSYYLETLTNQLADEAWTLFQNLESQGGFVPGWQNNSLKDALHEVAQEKFKRIASGEDILVGTNKFINPQEKFDYDPEELIQSRYFDTSRAAYSLEVMRFAVEMHYQKRRQKPRAVVVSIGDAIQRHLNASFAREFFGCAGFQTEVQHFDSVTQASEALPVISSQVIVLSASDEEYQAFARQLSPTLKSHKDKPAVILAANPYHMKAELREQGFDEFIFQGCDTATIVNRIQEQLQKE